jgi:hypothetical protein
MRRLVIAAAISWMSTAGAQQFTVNDILDSLQRGAARVNLSASDSVAARKLDSVANVLRAAGAGSIKISTLANVIARRRTGFGEANRWDPRATDLLAQAWFRDAILLLPLIANGSLQPQLDGKVPQKEADGILAPTDSLRARVQDNAMQDGREKLRRLEIKYGSGSPQLNVVEATANFVFQWLPGLRSATDGSPSRYEFLAAYRTMEISTIKSSRSLPDAEIVSGGQLGLRWYHWGAGWGTGSAKSQLLRPRYASAGLYVVGPSDTPFAKLTGVRRRHGGFVGWGGLHVGFVVEYPRRLLIGGDRQLVPHLF